MPPRFTGGLLSAASVRCTFFLMREDPGGFQRGASAWRKDRGALLFVGLGKSLVHSECWM
jgi:hypothetical protein